MKQQTTLREKFIQELAMHIADVLDADGGPFTDEEGQDHEVSASPCRDGEMEGDLVRLKVGGRTFMVQLWEVI